MYIVFQSSKVETVDDLKNAYVLKTNKRQTADNAAHVFENEGAVIVSIDLPDAPSDSLTIRNSPGAQQVVGRGNTIIGGNVGPGSVVGGGHVVANNIAGGNINGGSPDNINGYYVFGGFNHTDNIESRYIERMEKHSSARNIAERVRGWVLWFVNESLYAEQYK
jgi:hypothetical protein